MINAWTNTSAQPASSSPQTLGTSTPPQPINIDAQKSFDSNNNPGMKKGLSPKMLLSILVLVLVVLGAGAGLYMTSLNQDLRQQAAETTYNSQCSLILSDPPCSTVTGCTWSSSKCQPSVTVSECWSFNATAQTCNQVSTAMTVSQCTAAGNYTSKASCENENLSPDANEYSCASAGGSCVYQSACTNGYNRLDKVCSAGTICCKKETTTRPCYNSNCQALNINTEVRCPSTYPLETKPASCSSTDTGGNPPPGDTNTSTSCPDGSGNTVYRSDFHWCPSGDTTGDGKCSAGDENHRVETTLGKLTAAPHDSHMCWQIDYYPVDWDTSGESWSQGYNGYYCGKLGPENCTYNPPESYFCNSDCTTHEQCKTADSRFMCSNGKCRLEANPGSDQCQPAVGPQCLSINLTNVSDPTAAATADPEMGDVINFTCGVVPNISRYIFRVIEPDNTIVNLTATNNVSSNYTITKAGNFTAQCQICTGQDDASCLPYEPVGSTQTTDSNLFVPPNPDILDIKNDIRN